MNEDICVNAHSELEARLRAHIKKTRIILALLTAMFLVALIAFLSLRES